MTTQPNQDNVAAFMKELIDEVANLLRHNTEAGKRRAVVDWYLDRLQQSNRQLLDEVETKAPETKVMGKPSDYKDGFNDCNDRWWDAVRAIKERRGL